MSRLSLRQTPPSARALLGCVAIEAVVYLVWVLSSSTVDPVSCNDYCWSDRDTALAWGLGLGVPLVIGQVVLGGLAIALNARKDERSAGIGLLAFYGATAVSLVLIFGFYFLQST